MDSAGGTAKGAGRAITVAWLIRSLFYLHRYVMRSALAAPRPSEAFGLTTAGFASSC